MKFKIKLATILLLLVGITQGYGQISFSKSNILSQDNQLQKNAGNQEATSKRSSITCGPDTLQYARAKASALPAINLHLTQSADKLGQFFPAPQPVTVHGLTFYAWQPDGTGSTIDLWAKIYKAGPDSLPVGQALDSVKVAVDSSSSSITDLRYTVEFQNPITLDTPFVASLETNISRNTSVVTNSWDSQDGRQNWFGMGHIVNQGWLHGYEVDVGGVPFDADVALEPIVSYDLNADFSADTTCVLDTGTVNFTNNASPIVNSPVYNQLAFLDTLADGNAWQFGDGSPTDNALNPQHTYEPGNNNRVVLTNSMLGWTTTCIDSAVQVINQNPTSAYTYQDSALIVDFAEDIEGTPDSVIWTFQGDTSTMMNPTYTFDSGGVYDVCLLAISKCTSDTSCQQVQVCDEVTGAFTTATNTKTVNVSSTIANADTVSWSFGDNTTSSMPDPSHTYQSAGTYEVCLYAGNACGTDTTCQNVTVCDSLTGGFTFSQSGDSIDFTANVSATDTLVWFFGDGSSSTQTDPTHTYSSSGSFEPCLLFGNACTTDTVCKNITITSVRDKRHHQKLTIYPVPTKGQITFRWPDKQAFKTATVSIFNVHGQLVKQEPLSKNTQSFHQMDISSQEPGVYLLQVTNGKQTATRKITLLR
jgi:PKD repeat protein